ncbi:hypothetical protein RN001_004007 [Aquatica leii]|uniref:MOSC domain-containing protein n=1 Tax=Aquatica leii TaxID=1421715 RepID=A0AAN7PRR4_9COLE|nr:hypothetical protein RN001_004007 [Aquatica leii]
MPALSKIITVESVLAAATVGILTTVAVYWYQRRKKNRLPTEWNPVGIVTRLYIYPLKSGHEIELETAVCTELGVMIPPFGNLHQFRDRSFLIYNEADKKFETARTSSQLVHIKITAIDENHVTLNAPNMPILTLKIPNAVENRTDMITQHFGEKIPTIDCGDEAAKWISQYLKNAESGFRIGYNDGARRRNIDFTHQEYKKAYPRLRSSGMGLYSDFTSYLLVNQFTVNDLNAKMQDAQVTHRNFRPNILIEGAPPYAEDNWVWVKIGDVVLYEVKPCTRCVLTTVNPETGIKSAVNEPLRTLRKYRMLKDVKT